MPKRRKTIEEEIRRYQKKLRRLEEYRESPESVLFEQDGEKGEGRTPPERSPTDVELTAGPEPEQSPEDPEAEVLLLQPTHPEVPELIPSTGGEPTDQEVVDPDILNILGESVEDIKKFGPKISETVATRWGKILQKGLKKEERDALLQEYLVPSNLERLQAPILNPEIISVINDAAKSRDKKLEEAQQQLALGLTALSKAMSILIKQTGNLDVIALLNDSAKILSDLHHHNTTTRKILITPLVDKTFIDMVKEVDHDQFLYGQNLSEKIKSLKSIEKDSKTIKKAEFKKQGNFNGPPRQQLRYTPATRGTGRGGYRKPGPLQRRPVNLNRPPPAQPSKGPSSSYKQHARK